MFHLARFIHVAGLVFFYSDGSVAGDADMRLGSAWFGDVLRKWFREVGFREDSLLHRKVPGTGPCWGET